MVEAILSYVIKAIDESSSVMDRIKSSVGLLGSSLSGLGGGFASVGSVMTGFAAGGVAGAAISALGQVAQGLQWSIKEATDSEQAFKNLSEAVSRSGTVWTTVEAKTRDYLTQLQATTVYSDEALAGMVERLLTFGLSYEQAMNAAGAALDLAAAKHMDLESAASLVGKAVEGNTGILKRYGVDVKVAKDATDKFTPVIAALNEQFGGAAQAQAQTYAGIQERLKNATSELGEKIGGILLPSLASLTEGMIPVVDWLGKGVDQFQAWLTEVGKSSDLQPILKGLSDAFAGLGDYLLGLQKFMMDAFGPALKELMAAFKELWDALSPIGEALKELLGIFGDTGNMDLFKILIGTVVVQIRAVAEIIKEVAPYIKAFAQGFKDAVDFISPVLTQIVTAVRFCIDTLRTIFQDFYNWLIGRSLWTDLWAAVQRVTTEAIGQLLSAIRDNFLSSLRTAFDIVTRTIQTTWETAWTAMQTTFTTISDTIQAGWTSWTTTMRDNLTAFWSTVQTATTTALTAMQGYFTGAMSAIQGTLSGAISAMQGAWQAFASFMSSAFATFQGAVSGAASFLTSTLRSMQSAASLALGTIQGILSSAWATITGATAAVSTAVSTITSSLPSEPAYVYSPNIVGPQVETGYTYNPTTSTTPGCPPGSYWNGSACVPLGASPSPSTLNATIPITVTIDGSTVSKMVEKRIITTAYNSDKRNVR